LNAVVDGLGSETRVTDKILLDSMMVAQCTTTNGCDYPISKRDLWRRRANFYSIRRAHGAAKRDIFDRNTRAAWHSRMAAACEDHVACE